VTRRPPRRVIPPAPRMHWLMAAKDQGLYGHEQGLDAQDQRVHQADRVDEVQPDPMEGSDLRVLQGLVIARVEVGDAVTPLGQIVELALVERL
jgi:hypothetical protein